MADLVQKIKHFLKVLTTPEVYMAIVLILVGAASFGLGRLSALEESKPPVRILGSNAAVAVSGTAGAAEETAVIKESEEAGLPDLAPGGKYVASKNGSKYHFPWCSGAKRIAENNKVWFNSTEEARAAGYEPAANCKGLE